MPARNTVVTGASSGIGLATARRLLDLGHSVIGIARRTAPIRHAAFTPLSIDLAAPDAGAQLARVQRQYPHIDAVVSIAGGGQFGSLENFSAAQITQSITQNLTSHLLVARAFVAALKKRAHGNIVFMGSGAALAGSPQGSLYCAAKFGLRGFAQALRRECAARNVHVGIVNPGMVRDSFFDRQDFSPGPDQANALEVEDVVDAILLMLQMRTHAVVDEINLSPLKPVVNRKPTA